MPKPLSPRQLTCIQALWAQRMRGAGIAGADECRELRHAYLREVTAGRATSTKELTFADAKRVIERLLRDAGGQIKDSAGARAAGTHGRRGADRRVSMLATKGQIDLLVSYASRLGWNDERLDAFIERQLGAHRQVRTVADINKVLWGLKSMVRRQHGDTTIAKSVPRPMSPSDAAKSGLSIGVSTTSAPPAPDVTKIG